VALRSIKEIIDSELKGKTRLSTFRKVCPAIAVTAHWFDMSVIVGNPIAQYYAASPLEAKTLSHSANGGLFHGKALSPESKYLRRITTMQTTATVGSVAMLMLDYLMFYPFIDQSSTDPQDMLNESVLTRSISGEGVQVMAVSQAAQIGGQTFQFTYTNSLGVPGRVSQTVTMNAVAVNGILLTSSPNVAGCLGPFIPLQAGDTGIRSIESVQMNGADIGLFALVLVKPLATFSAAEVTAPTEIDFMKDAGMTLPRIEDDAYLNFIAMSSGSIASAIFNGYLETVWG
jgi:hypothetical protein